MQQQSIRSLDNVVLGVYLNVYVYACVSSKLVKRFSEMGGGFALSHRFDHWLIQELVQPYRP